MKKLLSVGLMGLTSVALAVPTVEIVGTPTQADNGDLVVTYKLTGAPAIITFDVETNDVTIGEANVYRLAEPQGDVSKLVASDGTYTIRWDADAAWPNRPQGASLRGVVSAWEPTDPPDYLVADITAAKHVRYYTSTNALPGGLLENPNYRTSKIVMKRIKAKGVAWNMGGSDNCHAVTLTSDYYFGVFPITQGQWWALRGVANHLHAGPCQFTGEPWWATRIADNLTYHHARSNRDGSNDAATYYPEAPGSNSYLGRLRAKTGVAFDLPGEAQWEYACRAGMSDADVWAGKWSDGSTTVNGRVSTNGGLPGGQGVTGATCPPENGCPTAGMYAPSRWGIYDMHGGVMEWCLDWYAKDISSLTGGQINANGAQLVSDSSVTGENRVTRGGCWFYGENSAKTTVRSLSAPNDGGNVLGGGGRGFRVACPVPAE